MESELFEDYSEMFGKFKFILWLAIYYFDYAGYVIELANYMEQDRERKKKRIETCFID